MTIKLKPGSFTGSGGVWDRKGGLEAVLRAMAVDNAKSRITTMAPSALTDNSTGDKNASYLVSYSPGGGRFNAAAADGVQAAGINTSLGKVKNAEAVLVTDFNAIRAKLGLPALTNMEGTVAAAHTVPALDKTATAGQGNAAVSYDSYVVAIRAARLNLKTLIRAFNEINTALGVDKMPDGLAGAGTTGHGITSIPTVTASSNGQNSVSRADGTAALTLLANGYARLAASFNAVFTSNTGKLYTAAPLGVVAA